MDIEDLRVFVEVADFGRHHFGRAPIGGLQVDG